MRFGTDGIRGPAGSWPLDAAGAARVGHAAARYARAGGGTTVLVGRDTRPSGPGLVDGVVRGIQAVPGVRAVDAGVVPTGGLAEAVAAQGEGAVGVMVTASHNPASDNGFKVLLEGGRKPEDDELATLEALLALEVPPAVHHGRERLDAVAAYVRRVGEVGLQGVDLRGRRIAVDLAHGAATAAWPALQAVLAGVELVGRGLGDGRINDGVGSEHPEGLAALVRAERCDAGLAVDGDGDRCLLVDERGEIVPGDALIGLLAAGLGVQRLAVSVMSSLALEAALPGVEVLRTPVGDRHLAEAIRTRGATLGGEESGHVLFADALVGGDGLVTGLRALGVAWRRASTLSAAVVPFAPWPRRLTKVRVAARLPLAEVGAVQAAEAVARARVGPGRTFLRYSGTEPVLRVLVEGPDPQAVDAASTALTAACQEALG
ncbi:MAG: phosphoglucosamine mutase [Alphaproteobacteria bacterium]|nr:phosphoglucosamine mutase [Alphaproteobacteria bacterium]